MPGLRPRLHLPNNETSPPHPRPLALPLRGAPARRPQVARARAADPQPCVVARLVLPLARAGRGLEVRHLVRHRADELAAPNDHDQPADLPHRHRVALRRETHGGIPQWRRPSRALRRRPPLPHRHVDEALRRHRLSPPPHRRQGRQLLPARGQATALLAEQGATPLVPQGHRALQRPPHAAQAARCQHLGRKGAHDDVAARPDGRAAVPNGNGVRSQDRGRSRGGDGGNVSQTRHPPGRDHDRAVLPQTAFGSARARESFGDIRIQSGIRHPASGIRFPPHRPSPPQRQRHARRHHGDMVPRQGSRRAELLHRPHRDAAMLPARRLEAGHHLPALRREGPAQPQAPRRRRRAVPLPRRRPQGHHRRA